MTVNAVKKFAIKTLLKERQGFIMNCFVCGSNYPKLLTLHHHNYYPDSVTLKIYPNEIQYYAMLLDEIKERPDNFTILCRQCDREIETILRDPTKYNRHLITDRMHIVLQTTLETRRTILNDEEYEDWLRGELW